MKQILILSMSDLAADPRVNRQIRLLKDRYRVTAAGYSDPCVAGVDFIRIPPIKRTMPQKILAAALLKCGRFERYYWSWRPVAAASRLLSGRSFDIVVANDINTLPLALKIAPTCGVVFDAHEYSPRELEDDWKWRFFFQRYMAYLCRTYIARAAAMVTVCEGIADEYERNFGMRPVVVHNAPWRAELAPGPCNDATVRLVHHGAAIPQRKIEAMIEMMTWLDARFSMDFYLTPADSRYLRRLQRMAARDNRIRMQPPVPMKELPAVLNRYDVGVYILEPGNFNHEHALPNKFFEFVQGRLAIAIAPSPEMARLVRRYDCGIVAEDFSPRALASQLGTLTKERLEHYKKNAGTAAQELCYERASQALLEVLSRVAERTHRPRCAA